MRTFSFWLLRLIVVLVGVVWVSGPGRALADSPSIDGAVGVYLGAGDPTGQTQSSAWNAGANAFANPPQSSEGAGQVNLPGIGTVTPTGSYTQDLVIPNGIPVVGGLSTGIHTTVNTYTDQQGHRIDVAPDPLSNFNYTLTHSGGASIQTGWAIATSFLGDFLTGRPTDGGASVWRVDADLARTFNWNYGEGWGKVIGTGVYVYPPEWNGGTGDGSTAETNPPLGTSASTSGNPPPPPGVPPAPPPLPTGGEQVYLKAVIPPAPPNFTLAFQPDYPTVVGQDPAKRGVDVRGRATLSLCTVIWHHVLHEYSYYYPNYPAKDPVEVRESTKEWDTTDVEPDAMGSVTVDSALSPQSAEYIQTELARIYPGTKIYQGAVRVYPSGWAKVTENALGVPSVWAFLAERVPYADPGKWDFKVTLQTTGTPHCGPLNWSKEFPGALAVWLREQRLVK